MEESEDLMNSEIKMKPKIVYGLPRAPLKPFNELDSSSQITQTSLHSVIDQSTNSSSSSTVENSSNNNHLSLQNHPSSIHKKSPLAILEEIDKMTDDDFERLKTNLTSNSLSDSIINKNFQDSNNLNSSSQPTLITTLSASTSKSFKSSSSTPSPSTPNNLSPLNKSENFKSTKRIRISDSDSDDSSIHHRTIKPKSISNKLNQIIIQSNQINHLSNLDQVLAQEKQLALAEAQKALDLEDQLNHPDLNHKIPPNQIILSDVESDSTEKISSKKPKLKKLKALTKKEKEQTQRTIASCERQQNFRLAGTYRVPTTKLEDIINKATSNFLTKPINASSHVIVGSDEALLLEQKLNSIDSMDFNAEAEAKKVLGDDDSTIDLVDEIPNKNENLDKLPQLPDLPSLITSPKSSLQRLKKEWLRKAKLQTQATVGNALANSDSDSDLEIIGAPSSLKMKNQVPSNHSHSNKDFSASSCDPFQQRLARQLDIQKTARFPIKALLGSNHDSSALEHLKTKPKVDSVMKKLLAKSAVESAKLREQKRAEFVERGGRLAKEFKNGTTIEPAELKAALIKSGQQAQNQLPEADDAVECDWDELGSVDEIDLIDQNEEVEEEDEEVEDEQEQENPSSEDCEDEEIDDAEDPIIEDGEKGDQVAQTEISRMEQSNSMPSGFEKCFLAQDLIESSKNISHLDSQSPSLATASSLFPIPSKVLAPDSSSVSNSRPSTSEGTDLVRNLFKPASESSSPIDLPGFDPKPKPTKKQSNNDFIDIVPSCDNLPGFGSIFDDKGFSPSLGGLTQFSQGINLVEKSSETGFSNLFEDDDQISLTHPLPLLKKATEPEKSMSKIPKIFLRNSDDDEAFPASCVLPAVNVLPEERERDMVMMMLDVQKKTEEDEEQVQYVNHRGLLTQNKPALEAGPPDSPLMSQDLIARTPFALRKDKPVTHLMSAEDEIDERDEPSPTELREGLASWQGSNHVSESPSTGNDEENLNGLPNKQPAVKNAFALVMNQTKIKPQVRKLGTAKMFLADQADESDDELNEFVNGGQNSKRGGDSEDEGSDDGVLSDLVNDEEDERDETTRLEGDIALEELAKKHLQEAEEKHSEQISKVVAGKIRLRQARNQRGDGGISDSDSEDDEEAERIKANQRARDHAAKKKKRAIHLIADKHVPFFKSYEEGTSQWVDEDDLTCFQPEDEQEESEDDEDDGFAQPVTNHRSRSKGLRPIDTQNNETLGWSDEFEEEEDDSTKKQDGMQFCSSPIQIPDYKISDPMLKRPNRPKGIASTKTLSSLHADVESMYSSKSSNQLTERHKSLVSELIGNEKRLGRISGGINGDDHVGGGASKSSSITYQNRKEQMRKNQMLKNQNQLDLQQTNRSQSLPNNKNNDQKLPGRLVSKLKKKHF